MTAPLPWTWIPRDMYVRDANGDAVLEVTTSDDDVVRMMLRAVNQHEARIGAACELYGALAQLVEVARGCGVMACVSPDPVLMRAAIERAQAAMQQAEQVGKEGA